MARFFNPNTLTFRLLVLPILIAAAYLSYQSQDVCYRIYVLSVLVLTGFGFFPFYPKSYRGLGIETHFRQLMTPSIYLLGFLCIPKGLNLNWHLVYVMLSILNLILIGLNILLVRCHINDADSLPPSYSSAELYLTDESWRTAGSTHKGLTCR